MRVRTAYNFDDVHLVPAYSELKGRMDVSLETRISWATLSLPLISAAMDTITSYKMANFMRSNGALGVLHRYMTIDEQVEEAKQAVGPRPDLYGAELTAVSVGVNGDAMQRALACVEVGVGIVMLDVAHGDTLAALRFVEELRAKHSDIIICSANIVTVEAARRYREAGADVLRVGLGSGSVCDTTNLTAVGYPQLSAVSEMHNTYPNVPILSDGGVRGPADVVKVLAAGASAVISGRLFAGYPWTPMPGVYRGMASPEALKGYKKDTKHAAEGHSVSVKELNHPQAYANFKELVNHIKIGLSYVGARNIQELQEKARWVEAK